MYLYKTIVTSGPGVEPLSTAEALTHLNLGSGQETYVDSLVKAARIQVERYLNRALINTTFKGYSDCFHNEFYLPHGTVSTVTSIKYYDVTGTEQTISSNDYWVSTANEPCEIEFKYDYSFPSLQIGRPDAIEIIYVAGYGASASSVPEPIRHAIRLLIGNFYENRSDVVVGANVSKIPNFITDLIHSYKLYRF